MLIEGPRSIRGAIWYGARRCEQVRELLKSDQSVFQLRFIGTGSAGSSPNLFIKFILYVTVTQVSVPVGPGKGPLQAESIVLTTGESRRVRNVVLFAEASLSAACVVSIHQQVLPSSSSWVGQIQYRQRLVDNSKDLIRIVQHTALNHCWNS
jgi:hypothetical protein